MLLPLTSFLTGINGRERERHFRQSHPQLFQAQMATDIRGYTAIITGAGSGTSFSSSIHFHKRILTTWCSGIGAAIAVRLAAAGCSVFLIGRTLSVCH